MTDLKKIYYISQGINPKNHLENISVACKAGCQLIQLRLKKVSHSVLNKTAIQALKICKFYNAKLIINDHIEIAQKFPAIGLHIGKQDISMQKARDLLPNTTIGGTANSFQDCLNLINNGADYIGLGPYAETNTKQNLAPVLGFTGYNDILAKLKSLKIDFPIYAIGGIKEKDIQLLLDIKLHGVALSGLLTNKREQEITQIIHTYE